MIERLQFASLHALIAFVVAFLLCRLLTKASANVRCWIWRLAMVKPLISLCLAVPVVVSTLKIPLSSEMDSNVRVVVPDPAFPWERLFFCLWGVGAFTLAVYLAWQYLNVRQLLSKCVWKDGYGVTEQVASPVLLGVIRPQIVLPETGLDEDGARMALLHELGHLERRDPIWSLIGFITCSLFWFLPTSWMAFRAMRLESEAACDARVLREDGVSPALYAQFLIGIAHRHHPLAVVLGASESGKRLSWRITQMSKKPHRLNRVAMASLVMIGAVCALPLQAISQVVVVTQEPNDVTQQEQPKVQAIPRMKVVNLTKINRSQTVNQQKQAKRIAEKAALERRYRVDLSSVAKRQAEQAARSATYAQRKYRLEQQKRLIEKQLLQLEQERLSKQTKSTSLHYVTRSSSSANLELQVSTPLTVTVSPELVFQRFGKPERSTPLLRFGSTKLLVETRSTHRISAPVKVVSATLPAVEAAPSEKIERKQQILENAPF